MLQLIMKPNTHFYPMSGLGGWQHLALGVEWLAAAPCPPMVTWRTQHEEQSGYTFPGPARWHCFCPGKSCVRGRCCVWFLVPLRTWLAVAPFLADRKLLSALAAPSPSASAPPVTCCNTRVTRLFTWQKLLPSSYPNFPFLHNIHLKANLYCKYYIALPVIHPPLHTQTYTWQVHTTYTTLQKQLTWCAFSGKDEYMRMFLESANDSGGRGSDCV